MNPKIPFKLLAPSALAIAVAATMAPAVIAEESPTLEEILVNARKTQESMQDVSVSVTAISGSDIDALIMRDVRELEGLVPNLIVDSVSVAPGGASLYIRGVGTQEVERSFDPAVGVVIDGVPLSFVNGSMANTFDFESVEVLRGPQGTLFGRNTTGGVININRTRPTGEFGVKYEATVGIDDLRDTKAVVNFPLSDNVAGKLGFARQLGGGSGKNIIIDEDVGDADNTEISATLLFTPTEDFEARLTYVNYKDENDGIPLKDITDPSNIGDLREFTQDFYGRDVDFEWDSYTLNMNFEMEKGTLTTILGYQDTDEFVPTDFDGTPIGLLHVTREQSSEQTTAEVRFASNEAFSEKLDFVAGLFYLTDEYQLVQTSQVAGIAGPGVGPDFTVFARPEADHERDAWAIFTEVHIDLTEQLMLTVGGRYSEEEKDYTGNLYAAQTYVAGSPTDDFFIFGTPEFGFVRGASGDEKWDEFTPKIGLDYRINDDVLTYVTYSEGFRSGGFNGRNSQPFDIGPYDPETVENWEVGMKGDFLDQTLRFNLAAFYNQYTDKQEEFIGPDNVLGSTTVVLNASEVEISGLEGELTWLACENLLVGANFGYLDAEYVDDWFDPDGGGLRSIEPRRVPDWTGGINTTYTIPVGPGEISLYASYRYTDRYHTDVANLPQGYLQDREVIDAIIAYEWETQSGRSYRISAFGRDVTDEIARNSAVVIPNFLAFSAVGGGEQYGVRISGSF